MTLLRPLAIDDRVAHREDTDWKNGDGIVTQVRAEGSIAWVKWPDFEEPQGPYNREELIAMDDEDVNA